MFTRKPGGSYDGGLTEAQANTNLPPVSSVSASTASASPLNGGSLSPHHPSPLPHDADGLVVVGPGTRVSGRIETCRRLEVYGILEADVSTELLIIHKGGGIKGTLEAQSAEVHGVIEGSLAVENLLDIRQTGHVSGELMYGRLAVESGAQVLGSIQQRPRDQAKPVNPPVRVDGEGQDKAGDQSDSTF